MKQNSRFLKALNGSAILAVCFLFWLQLSRIYVGDIKVDDFEHLASAWWIFNGYEPYRDFFQHHNPLFWYVIQPFFYLFENPLEAYVALRYFACFCYLAVLLSIALIIRQLSGNIQTIIYAFLIYMAYPIISGAYIQGRPDLPMMACLLFGIYFWIRFFKAHKTIFLILCYFSFFLSFAFLQKVVLFFVPFGIYQLYLLCKKELSWKDVGMALVLPVLISVGYGAYLYRMGMLWRYIELNWILNLHYFRDYQMYRLTIYDWVFHILFGLFLIYGFWKRKGLDRQLLLVLFGFSALFFLTVKPYRYYYMMFAPFMAVVIAFGIENLKKEYLKILFILFGLTCGIFSFYTRLNFRDSPVVYPFMEYFKDLEKLNDEDWIDYNAPPTFALYQKRPRQYYWYNWARGALWDIHLFHRHQLQNWNTWIYQTKPAVIIGSYVRDLMQVPDDDKKADRFMQLDEDFLKEYYNGPETEFEVYRLKKQESDGVSK